MTQKKCSPLSFVAVFGSGIRDPGSGIWDLGWVKIRIRNTDFFVKEVKWKK
jgi:hypothetical protein